MGTRRMLTLAEREEIALAPEPAKVEPQQLSAPGPDQPGRGPEQGQPQAFVLPPAGVVFDQGKNLCPGYEVQGEHDQLDPDLVGDEVVQGQVGQSKVLGGVIRTGFGAAAVTQLQVSELTSGVLVANAVRRLPFASVMRSCASGQGARRTRLAASRWASRSG